MDAVATAADLDAQLRALGTPERAAGSKAYLHSDLDFYGVTVPDARAVLRHFLKASPGLTHPQLLELVARLWHDAPVFERRLAAAMLLTERSASWPLDALLADAPLYERLLRESRTWALVDVLAGDALGPAFDRLDQLDRLDQVGSSATGLLDRWAGDPDFWLRRSALLVHQRPLRAGGGDWPRFAGYADAMLEEREFFIRKAIGWVLRETAQRRPDLVFDWLRPRAHRASGVTLREAVKKLSPEQAAEIRAIGKIG